MNGLWLKDLIVLKQQRLAFMLTFVLSTLCILAFRQIGVAIGMLIFALTIAFLMLSTVTFDQQNHGLRFLFTLPFTQRQYVRQKFLFLLATIAAGTVVMAVIGAGFNALFNWQVAAADIVFVTFAISISTFCILAITLQMQLANGPASAQVAMSLIGAIVAVLIGGCYVLIKFTSWGATVFQNLLQYYASDGSLVFIVALLLLGLVVGLTSYVRSVKTLLI
ncbi:ABC-2 transporter permease [Loigolactobacillus binensis]|uniref:ABC-2 transporter permease n=1 Tax=Loigolactobacillus binensis TaxID=2559922 RepID=A0ABW3EC12_9LACO|nr:ABC-2 transporter permease [Loigolactobacillus binensis]